MTIGHHPLCEVRRLCQLQTVDYSAFNAQVGGTESALSANDSLKIFQSKRKFGPLYGNDLYLSFLYGVCAVDL